MRRWFMLLVVLFFSVEADSSAKILVVLPLPARSHFKSFQPLFEELIKRGHNLTLISIEKLSKNLENNYTHIDVGDLTADKIGLYFAEMGKQSRLENLIFTNKKLLEHVELVLKNTKVKQLLYSKDIEFDLVMIELFHQDVYVAFGNHFKVPVIGLSAQGVIPFYKWITSNPMSPSYIPNLYLPYSNEMSFSERCWNTAFSFASIVYYEFVSLANNQKVMEDNFPFENRNKIPKVKDMMKNISLVLANYHFAFGYSEPGLPNYIQTAGLHITEPEALPENLQKFMDESTEGVIYISLGSLIQPEDVDLLGKIFIKVLQHFPQRIIFKWNPTILPSIPRNFLVQKWAPQASILRHPNCRLFITHGGLHSLLESVNYSVPSVGIPFFTDQQHNMAIVKHLGIGKSLDANFTEDQFRDIVQEILHSPKYYENVKLQSRKFNDRLVSPLNTAVYWIEYVLRYKDTPNHMKAASANLSWHQLFLLDVLLLIFFVIFLILISLYSIMKIIIYFCYALRDGQISNLNKQPINKNLKVQ